ncbi:hypothetical protein L1N85_08920 [Paenibacillus alkaliterrae]|uniref:hypothetical protein n=1 Tax=Paenibacillus alkaliterrae TaxID=320909 RepID=UPI001F3B75C2|nr:hypothetical protein [Paenibacillus alkaliterrae]MCF2938556.1 hypothetical protein [Paenibacillus alkaliterrae]
MRSRSTESLESAWGYIRAMEARNESTRGEASFRTAEESRMQMNPSNPAAPSA